MKNVQREIKSKDGEDASQMSNLVHCPLANAIAIHTLRYSREKTHLYGYRVSVEANVGQRYKANDWLTLRGKRLANATRQRLVNATRKTIGERYENNDSLTLRGKRLARTRR